MIKRLLCDLLCSIVAKEYHVVSYSKSGFKCKIGTKKFKSYSFAYGAFKSLSDGNGYESMEMVRINRFDGKTVRVFSINW